MRPIANFTVHAILAAALAALATSSAAAGGPATIKLGGAQGEAAGRNDGRVQQLEIHSWQWSAAAKVDSFTVKQGVKPDDPTQYGGWIADVERPAERTGENVQGSQDIVITGSRIPQPNLATAGGVTVASGDIAGDGTAAPRKPSMPPQTISPKRLPAGTAAKGVSMPEALERGTLRVKVKMPWLACEEGRKYPSLELGDGAQRLELKDVVIANCGTIARARP